MQTGDAQKGSSRYRDVSTEAFAAPTDTVVFCRSLCYRRYAILVLSQNLRIYLSVVSRDHGILPSAAILSAITSGWSRCGKPLLEFLQLDLALSVKHSPDWLSGGYSL
jgi:hypothetical protein